MLPQTLPAYPSQTNRQFEHGENSDNDVIAYPPGQQPAIRLNPNRKRNRPPQPNTQTPPFQIPPVASSDPSLLQPNTQNMTPTATSTFAPSPMAPQPTAPGSSSYPASSSSTD